jgi:WD40 repeat protein
VLAAGDAEYLAQSIRRARRAARRPAEVIVALIVALALAVSGGLYTLHQRDVARQQSQAAQIGELDAESHALGQSDPRESLLLALDAYHQEATPQTYAQLLAEVTQTRYAGILLGHASTVESVTYRPAGGILASGDDKGTVILWSTAQGRRLASFKAVGPVWDLAFSPDGDTLAVGTQTGSVQLWNLTDPAHPALLTTLSALGYGDTADNASVAYTTDGDTLAATDYQNTLTVWHAADPAHPTLLSRTDLGKGHPIIAGNIALSPDGRTLLIGNTGIAIATLWDMSDPAHPRYLSALAGPGRDYGNGVYAVAFSPDGSTVATGVGITAYTYLWHISNRSAPVLISTMTGQGGPVFGLAFSPDGSRLATASRDGTTELWNVSQPARPAELALLRGQQASVNTVAFSPDGNTIATGSDDRTIVLWNADTSTDTPVLATLPGPSSADPTTAMAYDGSLLAVGHQNEGTVELWDTSDPAHPRLLTTLPAPPDSAQVMGLALSPRARMLAVATSASNGVTETSVTLWNVTSPGRPSKMGALPNGAYQDVAFNPAGTIIAVLNGATQVQLFNITDPRDPRSMGSTAAFQGNPDTVLQSNPDTVAFSPNGHLIAIGFVAGLNQTSGLVLYSVTDSRAPRFLIDTDKSDYAIYAVAFSPNGSLLASTTESAGVLLWKMANPAHPAVVADLTGNFGITDSVAFGPGNILATSGYDRTTILWNLTYPALPVQMVSLIKQGGTVGPVAFSPSGTTLATASWDSTTVLWDVTRLTAIMRQPVLSACRIASPRNMPASWSADVPGIPYQPGCP